MIKLTEKAACKLLKKYLELKNNNTKQFHSSKSFERAYLTDMFQEVVDSGEIVTPIILNDLWFEIDTVEDLSRAEKILKI